MALNRTSLRKSVYEVGHTATEQGQADLGYLLIYAKGAIGG